MTPPAAETRWGRVETLFHQAVAIAPEDRGAFLDKIVRATLNYARNWNPSSRHPTRRSAI